MKVCRIIAVLAVLVLAVSCNLGTGSETGDPVETEDPAEKEKPKGVDFTDYNTGYSIRVRNLTSEKLVAFKGGLAADRLIGGIPAKASQHGLKKDPVLFGQKSEDFPLVLLTESQYEANKSNLKALEQTPFTRIFAFYNANGSNENIYEISASLGGNNTILIQNMSSMNVELRLNGINGETLGYAASGMLNTKFFVNDDDYLIFPVFKKYNAVRDEITTVYPKGAAGIAWYEQIQLGADGQKELSLDVSDILKNTDFSTGTAWIIIDNQSDSGIQFQRGGVIQRTATGIATINNGYSRTFQIDMAKVGDGKYAASANISAYTVGRAGGQIEIGNYDLEVDKIYKVTVTGSANAGTLTASAPSAQGSVSLDDFTSN